RFLQGALGSRERLAGGAAALAIRRAASPRAFLQPRRGGVAFLPGPLDGVARQPDPQVDELLGRLHRRSAIVGGDGALVPANRRLEVDPGHERAAEGIGDLADPAPSRAEALLERTNAFELTLGRTALEPGLDHDRVQRKLRSEEHTSE